MKKITLFLMTFIFVSLSADSFSAQYTGEGGYSGGAKQVKKHVPKKSLYDRCYDSVGAQMNREGFDALEFNKRMNRCQGKAAPKKPMNRRQKCEQQVAQEQNREGFDAEEFNWRVKECTGEIGG